MRTRLLLLLVAAPYCASAHAPVLPPIKGPLVVRGSGIVDSTGDLILLRGVSMPGLEVPDPQPGSADARNVAAMTGPTFGVIRVRWNMNTVRLPVSVALWQRDGSRYLDRVAEVVRLANEADLVVTLSAHEDARSGSPLANGLPSANTVAFWREWAEYFRDNPRVIFSVFNQPLAGEVPGAGSARTVADWRFWLNGGSTIGGQRAVGMQDLVDEIRATGAQQLIAVSGFHGPAGFREMTSELFVRGVNVIYETHPYYDAALSDADREASFGFLASQVPVYAGEWGLESDGPGCLAVTREAQDLIKVLFDTLVWFEVRKISWTAASFQPGSLVSDFVDYLPTSVKSPWTCGPGADPGLGMGEVIVILTTGDPTGFGALRPEQVANSAGGPASPLAPGQLITIYAEQLGSAVRLFASVGQDGKLPTTLGGTQVLIDGVAAPLLSAWAYQIEVQTPYELVPGKNVTMQIFFRGIPSNRASLQVNDAAPELFRDFSSYAIAYNEDGSPNGPRNAAAAGSVVAFFASGCGVSSSPLVTGAPAPSPHPALALPVELTVQDQSAEVVFTGYVPGFVGLAQINARLPVAIGSTQAPRPARVTLQVGSQRSRSPVLIWIR